VDSVIQEVNYKNNKKLKTIFSMSAVSHNIIYNNTMDGHVNIFFIRSSSGYIWKDSYTSFQSALDVLTDYVKKENSRRYMYGLFDEAEDAPLKIAKEFAPMDPRGNIVVAHDSHKNISFAIQQLTTYPYQDPYTRKSS